jgi:hypothetical protein
MGSEKQPLPGARDAMLALKAAGYKLTIFTSRLSEVWAISVIKSENVWKIDEFLRGQRQYVTDMLTKYDIPFDDITAEKVPAEFYIDDKAFRFEGDWQAVRMAALSSTKGKTFYRYHSNRGPRVHRVFQVERAPQRNHRYNNGKYETTYGPSEGVELVMACGWRVALYGATELDYTQRDETGAYVVIRQVPTQELLDREWESGKNPRRQGLLRNLAQPACYHCARSNRALEEQA